MALQQSIAIPQKFQGETLKYILLSRIWKSFLQGGHCRLSWKYRETETHGYGGRRGARCSIWNLYLCHSFASDEIMYP